MKRRIGISIYPNHSNLEEDLNYLEKAAELGFERVFMSMLEIDKDADTVLDKFKRTIGFANEKNMEVVLDIAPNLLKSLDISYDDLTFFEEIGASGIRLDQGYDGKKEALISYNPEEIMIELNMSNNVFYLDNILSHQANEAFIYGCHNFYPQRNTALDYDFFIESSKRFKKYGIKTAAFVTSQEGTMGPWSVNDGLPTLEMHRDMAIEIQAKHLFATGLIDDVIIGNAYASDEELKRLSKINKYQLELDVRFNENNHSVENKIISDEQHFRRGDISNVMVRSTEVRKKYKDDENPPHDNEQVFKKGDVLIGNDGFGKYKNELQLALADHSDSRKNKVGEIVEEEKFLLDYIYPWTKFKLR